MSDRCFEIRRESITESHNWNNIPPGRQLARTPPLTNVTKHLDFCDADEDYEADTRAEDEQNRTFDVHTPATKTDPNDPTSMLKGMKGYQLTPDDLEFIKKMHIEKLIKTLQGDLEEVQRSLKKEMMAAELVFTSREKALAALKMLPSCEDLTEWVKVVLRSTSPLAELTDVDTKSLLAMVTKEDIEKVMDEKKIEINRMEKMVANKKKKEAKEKEKLEKQIASEQAKIQGLMSQLSNLKSELAQHEEAYKAPEMQINTEEAAEIKVEAEEVETSEEQAANSQVKRRGRKRIRADKSTEKLQDTANQSKSTRSKHTDDQSSAKDGYTNESASKAAKTKQKSRAAAEKKQAESVKAARGSQKKLQEKEPNPQAEAEQAVRGRRKPAGAAQTAASQVKNQSTVKKRGEAVSSHSRQKAAGAAEEEEMEETQNTGLRRSKRIASRR